MIKTIAKILFVVAVLWSLSFVFKIGNSFAESNNACSNDNWSWSIETVKWADGTPTNEKTANFKWKNKTSMVAKIKGVKLFTKSGKLVDERIFKSRKDYKTPDPDYVKPYSDSWTTLTYPKDFPWEIVSKASIICESITEDQYENELLGISKSTNNTTTNNWSRTNNKPKGNIWIWGGLAALFLMFVVWLSEGSNKKKVKTKKFSKPKQTNINLIQYVWNGNETLSKTFWIYCILIGVIVSLISGILMGIVSNLFSIIPVIYFTWSSIGLWNSSSKYQISKLNLKQSYGWAIASKIYVVINLFTVFGQSILLFAN